jgi:hypothetical protein
MAAWWAATIRSRTSLSARAHSTLTDLAGLNV